MALIPLQYCNASLGKLANIGYDDATRTVTGGNLSGTNCSDGLAAGEQIYEHIVTATKYIVAAKNTPPYAYVITVSIEVCQVMIEDLFVTNATTSESSDGQIAIYGTNLGGSLAYSIDNGVTFRGSGIFSGLAPGTYTVIVRNTVKGQTCFTSPQQVQVGFNSVVCSLRLGNITVVKTSNGSASDGSIAINTITNPQGLSVEYRLDSGTWQDSATFSGLPVGTYNVQVRYKNFTSCVDSLNVTVQATVTCDIFIQQAFVTHEQTKFGKNGLIQVIAASSNGPIQYSKDGGVNYQSGNTFANLPPGDYNIRIRDAASCTDSRLVTVLQFKAPYIQIPLVNSHRFVLTSAPGLDNSIQNFENTLFKNMKFVGVDSGNCYFEKFLHSDAFKIQWRSNYTNNTLRIYRWSDNELIATIPTSLVKDYTRRVETISVILADAGSNRTQLFFESGLPDWAVAGQRVTISGTVHSSLNQSFEIIDVSPGVLLATGYSVALVGVAFPTTGLLNASVTVEYDIEPFDVWEAGLLYSSDVFPDGKYYARLDGSDPQFASYIAISEPFEVANAHQETVLLKFKNADNDFEIFYDTGIEHIMRVPADLHRPQPGGEEINYEDSKRRLIKLQEYVTFNPLLFLESVPPYLAFRVASACAHDSLLVNNVQYGKQDEKLEIEYFDNDPYCNASIKLRKYQYFQENSDDAGDVDVPQNVLEVNGVLLRIQP